MEGEMTTQKLDFDLNDAIPDLRSNLGFAFETNYEISIRSLLLKIKQVCQAVDAINDNKELLNKVAELSMKINILNSSLREFEKQKVDPLKKRIDAINERLEFVERKLGNYKEYKTAHCKHNIDLGSLELLKSAEFLCKLCGYIKVFGDVLAEQKTECKHDLHLWNDYYQKCNNCEQLFWIRESENLKSDAEQHTINCHAHKGGLCNCSLEKKKCEHELRMELTPHMPVKLKCIICGFTKSIEDIGRERLNENT